MKKKLTVKQIATATGSDEVTITKILKLLTINLGISLSEGCSVELPYLGTFSKPRRFWTFDESEYLSKIRKNKITQDELLNLLLFEDDKN